MIFEIISSGIKIIDSLLSCDKIIILSLQLCESLGKYIF